jgi:hypothetical protein
LHPSAGDLNQISSVLPVEMFRHVETLGRTIEEEVAFRFHVSPSGTCGRTSKLVSGSINAPSINTPFDRYRSAQFKGSKLKAAPMGQAKLGQKHRQTVDHAFGHEILGGIA